MALKFTSKLNKTLIHLKHNLNEMKDKVAPKSKYIQAFLKNIFLIILVNK